MSGRYVYEHRKKGDVASASPEALDLGKKLLDYLSGQRKLGLATTLAVRQATSDGTMVTARFVEGLPEVTYDTRGRDSGERNVVRLFTSSSTHGLCVFDLYHKRLLRNYTGLESLVLFEVDDAGDTAYMGDSTLVARVDMESVTAQGKTYPASTSPLVPSGDPDEPTVTGVAAVIADVELSPDGTRVVIRYNAVGVSGGSGIVLRDGYGVLVVADAGTLEPIRGAIRGGIWNATKMYDSVAWSSDSEFFYAPSVFDYDIGDLTIVGQFPLFYQSNYHYLAKYTRDGTFVAAQQLAAWGYADVSTRDGLGMMVRNVVSANNRLYVSVINWGSESAVGVYILDENLNVLDYAAVPDFYSYVTQIVVRDNIMVIQGRDPSGTVDDTYVVYDVTGDAILRLYKTKDTALVFGRMGFGVHARADGSPDGLLYAAHAVEDGGVWVLKDMQGFSTLKGPVATGTPQEGTVYNAPSPVYRFDLTPWNARFDWHMASAGAQPLPRKAV